MAKLRKDEYSDQEIRAALDNHVGDDGGGRDVERRILECTYIRMILDFRNKLREDISSNKGNVLTGQHIDVLHQLIVELGVEENKLKVTREAQSKNSWIHKLRHPLKSVA